jgi:hypothetical protein
VSGHGFSRANQDFLSTAALAAEVSFWRNEKRETALCHSERRRPIRPFPNSKIQKMMAQLLPNQDIFARL